MCKSIGTYEKEPAMLSVYISVYDVKFLIST